MRITGHKDLEEIILVRSHNYKNERGEKIKFDDFEVEDYTWGWRVCAKSPLDLETPKGTFSSYPSYFVDRETGEVLRSNRTSIQLQKFLCDLGRNFSQEDLVPIGYVEAELEDSCYIGLYRETTGIRSNIGWDDFDDHKVYLPEQFKSQICVILRGITKNTLLFDVANNIQDAWITHSRLAELQSDLQRVRSKLQSHPELIEEDRPKLICSIHKLIVACEEGQQFENVGVWVQGDESLINFSSSNKNSPRPNEYD